MRRAKTLVVIAVLSCARGAAADERPAAGGGAATVASVEIVGATLEPPDRLAHFLGIERGARVEDPAALESRLDDSLKMLGYEHSIRVLATAAGVELRIVVKPAQVVRHVSVHGNWPVFDDEIKRRLTLRSGSRLPPGEADREALLAAEAKRVRDYLHRDGRFDADADVVVEPSCAPRSHVFKCRPEWVDLRVLVHLGSWYKLTQVVPDGARVLRPSDFLSFFGSRKPWWLGRFRLDGLRDDAHDAEKEYRDRGYPAARVLPDFDQKRDLDPKSHTATLRVHVTEKARVELSFVGNASIPERQLRDRVTIFSSGSYDDVELQDSARELHRLYQSNGFFEAKVSYARHRKGDVEEITFTIDEGPQLKVRSVEFAPEPGAPPLTVDEKTLRGLVATRPFPRLGVFGLGEGGFVTAIQLQQDVDKILAYYRAAGYPEVRARGEVVRDPRALGRAGVLGANVAAGYGRNDDLYVRFSIAEGPAETVDGVEVRFRGPHSRSEADIARVVGLGAGAAYSEEALKAALRRVVDLYAGAGHPYMVIEPPGPGLQWTTDPAGRWRRVHIPLTIEEGPEVRFGEILIRGNFKTADWVIRRDLPFRTGDLFDVNKLAIAERNLQTHAIFNGVRVIPLGLAGAVNPVPILVEIQQERYDDWGTPQLSIGYSTDVGLLISPAYFWGNVFGGGGQAELRGEVAFDLFEAASSDIHSSFYRRLLLSLRYVHPHLIWPALRTEVAGFARKENTVRLGEIDSGGVTLSASWVASPSFRLFGRYDWTLSSLASIDYDRLPGRGDSTTAITDKTRTGKLTVGAVFDDRVSFEGAKNPLMPISGWLVAGSLSVAAKWLQGSHDFLVVSGQVQRYQPLGRGVSMIFNLRGDWGIPLGDEQSLPAVDRFFAGGDVATRGFETDKLRTEIIRGDVSPAPGGVGYRVVPEGGNIRFLGTLELQFPITEVAGFPWVGAVFFDAGTVFDGPTLFDFTRDVKVSVGITLLRFLTPVGPISLEYAYPITQTIAEQEWRRESWYRHWPGLIHFNWGIPILR
jgi:outer membrane protein assembly complex protein YaeT